MPAPRTDADLVRLHAALRKEAFEKVGAQVVQSAIGDEAKTASTDPAWTLALRAHLGTP